MSAEESIASSIQRSADHEESKVSWGNLGHGTLLSCIVEKMGCNLKLGKCGL